MGREEILRRWAKVSPPGSFREELERIGTLSHTSAHNLPIVWSVTLCRDEGLRVEIDVNRGTSYAGSCLADARKAGLPGRILYWDGRRIAQDVMYCRKPHKQATRLITAYARFREAIGHFDIENEGSEAVEAVAQIIRKAMPLWIKVIEDPCRAQLEKAKKRTRTLAVSRKAVGAFEELRREFEVLDARPFAHEEWCLPTIDERLDYWREQLAFIENRIAAGDTER